MPSPIRTFIAVPIEIPPALRNLLRQLREMGRAIRAVDSANCHITAKFLGNTLPEQLPEVVDVLRAATRKVKPFDIELHGIGAFPHWGRPLVVWAGLNSPEPLIELAAELVRQLEPLGFAKEKRAYHPHLTLARIKAKPPAVLKELADANESTSFGSQRIDRVILYQSNLQQSGPVYTPLETVSLTRQ